MAIRIFHIILSLSVLLSTTGLMMGKHFCQKEMQLAEANVSSNTSCQGNAICGGENGGCEKGCCSNEYKYFQSDQDKQFQTNGFKQIKQPPLLAIIPVDFNVKLPVFETSLVNFETYRPPIVQKDILTLFQTFLC